MLRLWRILFFGATHKRRQRYLRGLRIEMLMARYRGGEIEIVDEWLFRACRETKLPPLAHLLGHEYLYLRVPVMLSLKEKKEP